MKNDLIAVDGVCLANSSYLRDFFNANSVEVHLETGVCEITDKGVVARGKDGSTFEIDADSVITSIGYIPTPVAQKGVHVIGDSKRVGNLRTVIWGAWDVAMKI